MSLRHELFGKDKLSKCKFTCSFYPVDFYAISLRTIKNAQFTDIARQGDRYDVLRDSILPLSSTSVTN